MNNHFLKLLNNQDKFENIDAEAWHSKIIKSLNNPNQDPHVLKLLQESESSRVSNPKLSVDLAGIHFENPLMVGAGWDKLGFDIKSLSKFGFSGVEVGTIPANPQPGNPKPRFSLTSNGVSLNAFGFNSLGMDEAAKNLEESKNTNIRVGISLGKNKEVSIVQAPEAYAKVAQRLFEYGDYFAINVSSPNTPGLREMQDKKPLKEIAEAVLEKLNVNGKSKPLFIKVAPDLTYSALDDVITLAIDLKLAGIIASNTSNKPELKVKYGWQDRSGGVAGNDPEFTKLVTAQVAYIYKNAGNRLEIIGVGGIKDTESALEKILAGSKIIQVVSALWTQGPTIAQTINHGLVNWMDKNGVKNISDIVGQEASKYYPKK